MLKKYEKTRTATIRNFKDSTTEIYLGSAIPSKYTTADLYYDKEEKLIGIEPRTDKLGGFNIIRKSRDNAAGIYSKGLFKDNSIPLPKKSFHCPMDVTGESIKYVIDVEGLFPSEGIYNEGGDFG